MFQRVEVHLNCKKMVDAAKQLLSTAKTEKIQPRLMLGQPLRQISASERRFEKEILPVAWNSTKSPVIFK